MSFNRKNIESENCFGFEPVHASRVTRHEQIRSCDGLQFPQNFMVDFIATLTTAGRTGDI